MKTLNIYFQAVTKVQVGYVEIEDDESIDDYIPRWVEQGYVRCHYINHRSWIYVPWVNVVYCQCLDT